MENVLLTNKNVLICSNVTNSDDQLEYLKKNFCGKILNGFDSYSDDLSMVYFCGDVSKLKDYSHMIKGLQIVKEYSYNLDSFPDHKLITIGQVPINIHGCGVMVRQFLNNSDHFKKLHEEHEFQELTESNKPGKAHRKGIYLSKVTKDEDKLRFNLLRCSSNLTGPTDNFRQTDTMIIEKANDLASIFFEKKTELNHVLAQVYHNFVDDEKKERKATIKAHSDKTKDMDPAGLIAFTTIYNSGIDKVHGVNKSKVDPYDYVYHGNVSVLTSLHFKLKSSVTDSKYPKEFSVKLYPNSIFIIPLSTNRLYTHEIKPSNLPIKKLPTRIGYVIRCSNKKAYYDTAIDKVMLDEGGEYIPLKEVTKDGEKDLKDTYFKENVSKDKVSYDVFDFSFNKGDYMKPIV